MSTCGSYTLKTSTCDTYIAIFHLHVLYKLKQKTKFVIGFYLFSDETYLEKVKDIDIKKDLQNIEPSNVFQIEAIKNTLNNSFSLIHGPPGWF